jgi:hypothetical protein
MEQTSEMPGQVVVALWLIGIDMVLTLIVISRLGEITGLGGLITILLQAVIYTLIWWGLYRRINWVRWFEIVSAIIGLLLLPWTWPIMRSHGVIPLSSVKYVIHDTGVILLCLPQANRWFSRKATS